MSKSFVNEVNLYAFGAKVAVYRLQTGDVSDERRSGKAPEHEHGVFAFDTAERKLLTIFIVDCDVGHLLSDG